MILTLHNPNKKAQCNVCHGLGYKTGLGGIKSKCNHVELNKKSSENKDNTSTFKFDRRSKAYKETHKKLTDLGLSAEEAHKEIEEVEDTVIREDEQHEKNGKKQLKSKKTT